MAYALILLAFLALLFGSGLTGTSLPAPDAGRAVDFLRGVYDTGRARVRAAVRDAVKKEIHEAVDDAFDDR